MLRGGCIPKASSRTLGFSLRNPSRAAGEEIFRILQCINEDPLNIDSYGFLGYAHFPDMQQSLNVPNGIKYNVIKNGVI